MRENTITDPNFDADKYYSNVGSKFNNYYDMKFDDDPVTGSDSRVNTISVHGSVTSGHNSGFSQDVHDVNDLNALNYINNINKCNIISDDTDISGNITNSSNTNLNGFVGTVYVSPDKFSSNLKNASDIEARTDLNYTSVSNGNSTQTDSAPNYGAGSSFDNFTNTANNANNNNNISNSSGYESSPFKSTTSSPEHIHIDFDEPIDLTKKPSILSRPISENVVAQSYILMTFALIITAISASITINSDNLMYTIATSRNFFYGLLILELVVVIIASQTISRNQPVAATILFVLYSALNGVTFSVIFIAYQLGSVITIFLLSAVLFGLTGAFGLITKRDLSKFGNLMIMGLFGIIILGVANIFLRFSALEFGINVVGVFVFIGLSAYDSQKIKQMAESGRIENTTTLALYGALELYLDFINLFLKLLRLFGKRK